MVLVQSPAECHFVGGNQLIAIAYDRNFGVAPCARHRRIGGYRSLLAGRSRPGVSSRAPTSCRPISSVPNDRVLFALIIARPGRGRRELAAVFVGGEIKLNLMAESSAERGGAPVREKGL